MKRSYEEICKEANILTIKETMEEEDKLQMWRMMSSKDMVDRRSFWKLETEVQARERPPRARVGHLEVVVTHCRKTSFAAHTQCKWNQFLDQVKMKKTSKEFRKTYWSTKDLPD